MPTPRTIIENKEYFPMSILNPIQHNIAKNTMKCKNTMNNANEIFEKSQSEIKNNIILSDFSSNTKEKNTQQKNLDSGIKAFITKDKELLQQYYDLRHDSYRNENGWMEYDGSECENDRKGDIVIVTNAEGKVIGGCRLKVSRKKNELLFNEVKGSKFLYKNFLKDVGIKLEHPCSESSSVVVAKGYRDAAVTTKLLEEFARYSVANQCKYMFGVAVIACCRDYRKVFRNLGYQVNIGINFPWEENKTYNFARLFPMVARIND